MRFREYIDTLIQVILCNQQILNMGDLNGHVGTYSYDFDQVHQEYGYDTRNDEENVVLKLALYTI